MTISPSVAFIRRSPGIREVSVHIATKVAEEAHRAGLARRPRPADIEADIRSRMFVPNYQEYV